MRYQAQRSLGSVISSPRPWLYKVVFNVIMDGTGEPNVPLDEASAAQDPACGPHEYAELSALENRLTQILSPRELAAVRLRSEGLSYDEIACSLGLQVGSVGAMLSRAIVKIKRHMAINDTRRLAVQTAPHSGRPGPRVARAIPPPISGRVRAPESDQPS